MNYSSMKAQEKSKKQYSIDFDVSKSTKKKIKRSMKKSTISWLCVLLFFAIGVAGGFFAHKFAFANDTYQMVAYANGEADIYIGENEEFQTYTELGVKCVAFGKDYSKDCTVKYYYRESLADNQVEVDEVDEAVAGIYYAVYTTPASKYKTVTLIRNIIVLREEA